MSSGETFKNKPQHQGSGYVLTLSQSFPTWSTWPGVIPSTIHWEELPLYCLSGLLLSESQYSTRTVYACTLVMVWPIHVSNLTFSSSTSWSWGPSSCSHNVVERQVQCTEVEDNGLWPPTQQHIWTFWLLCQIPHDHHCLMTEWCWAHVLL